MGGSLGGKVVAVTGAGRGIGRGIALLAASEGASVVVADYGGAVNARSKASSAVAESVVAEIEDIGGKAVASAEDVATMDGGERIVRRAVDTFGRIDGMVCCAGITITKYLWELTENEWDDVIAVHLKGHFSCFQAAARVMMDQGSGSLVAIGSGAAFTSPPNLVPYSAAKAGVLGLMWSTANALRRHGITTNCVVPSAATRMSDSIYGSAKLLCNEVGQTMHSQLAAGTYRDPAHVAPTAVYLLSEEARDINGQVFLAQGYEVQHLGPIRWDKSMTNAGPWDVATLAERLPAELGPVLAMPSIPFPESRLVE